MNTRVLVGGLVALAFIIFGVTLYYSLSDRERSEVPREEETEETGFIPDVINVLHQFKDGTHTVAGEIEMPTPCDLLELEPAVEVREPQEDRALLQFTTVHEGEVCAQMITPVRFKDSFNAGEGAELTGTWNGRAVELNVIEVDSDDNIDDFELYFKG